MPKIYTVINFLQEGEMSWGDPRYLTLFYLLMYILYNYVLIYSKYVAVFWLKDKSNQPNRLSLENVKGPVAKAWCVKSSGKYSCESIQSLFNLETLTLYSLFYSIYLYIIFNSVFEFYKQVFPTPTEGNLIGTKMLSESFFFCNFRWLFWRVIELC